MPATALTFNDLCRLEPRLRALEDALRQTVADLNRKRRRCANAAWFGYGSFAGRGIKPRLLRLVGWERPAGPDALRTAEAYDVAYRHLYGLLPSCRGCLCM